MLGCDASYYRGEDDQHLIALARRESRVILTRNTKLIPRGSEDQIIRITEDDPSFQLKELFQNGCIILDQVKAFSRCLDCNGLLAAIQREEAEGKVPDFILYHQKEFFRCPQCRKIYWRGSHHQNMERWLKQLFNDGDRQVLGG